jgi:hypothetical protein
VHLLQTTPTNPNLTMCNYKLLLTTNSVELRCVYRINTMLWSIKQERCIQEVPQVVGNLYSYLGYSNFYLCPSLVFNMDKDLYVKFSVLSFICMTSLHFSRRDSHDINMPSQYSRNLFQCFTLHVNFSFQSMVLGVLGILIREQLTV